MTDFDSIWRTQDEIRTVVNAVLGECIWNLSYNERRMAIELELTKYLEEEEVDKLINQFPVPAPHHPKAPVKVDKRHGITNHTLANNTPRHGHSNAGHFGRR